MLINEINRFESKLIEQKVKIDTASIDEIHTVIHSIKSKLDKRIEQ
jgi:hypothetical protein